MLAAALLVSTAAFAQDVQPVRAEELGELRMLVHVDPQRARAKADELRNRAQHHAQRPLLWSIDAAECRLLIDVDPPAALSLADARLRATDLQGEAPERLLLQACRGAAAIQSGRVPEGVAQLEEVLASADALGLVDVHTVALFERGSYRTRSTDSVNGQADLLAACAALRRHDPYQLLVDCGEALAIHYANVGDTDQALRYHQDSLTWARAHGARHLEGIVLYNIGRAARMGGRHDHALQHYQQALDIEQAKGDRIGVAYNESGIGNVLREQGHAEQALPYLLRSAEVLLQMGDVEATSVYLDAADVWVTLGRPDPAFELLMRIEASVRAWASDDKLSTWYRILAEVQAARGQWQAAYEARSRFAEYQAAVRSRQQAEQAARLRLDFDRERAAAEMQALRQLNAQGDQLQRLQRLVIGLAGLLLLLAVLLVLLLFRRIRQIRRLAMTDELTQLANRRAILQAARSLLAHPHLPLGLLLVDVDHFKRINDQYGHDQGDRVLQAVAATLARAVTGEVRVGRLGGEEFLIVAPGHGPQAALALAERVRRAIAEGSHGGDSITGGPITISVGVACSEHAGESLTAILAGADAALYQAKHAGRNRVVVRAG